MRLSRDPAARRRLLGLCVAAAAATVAGAVVGAGHDGAGGGHERTAAERAAKPPARASRAAERLPLEQQVGQLLITSFDGTSPPAYIPRLLRRGQVAGVIIFGKNVGDARSLHALTAELQRAGHGGTLIATDQEGGQIRSVGFGPPESSQAALTSTAAAREAAARTARFLRETGVNVNLAPVADVTVPGSGLAGRGFAGDAGAVARLVDAAVRAHLRERVAATAKHFPGLGRAQQNTDDAPVAIEAPRRELERSDLLPFRAAVDAGVPLVMASHALFPAFDGHRIASQSPVLVERLLRGELGFRGAVITDSMEAEAVLARSDVAVAAERAVEAGVDLVLMTGSGSWRLVYPRLLRRARSEAGFRARVAEAAGRVLALKRRLGLQAPAGTGGR